MVRSTRRRVCHSVGTATIDSSSRTTGTATRGPSSSASGGDITIAPPNPVMPRTAPAASALEMARIGVAGSTLRSHAAWTFASGHVQAEIVMSIPAKRTRACPMSVRRDR